MLACSESEHELGIKVVGYKQERTFVWNNAIPAILFQDVKQPDGILPNERFIISIGRSSYPKNPLLMVETMKRCMKNILISIFILWEWDSIHHNG